MNPSNKLKVTYYVSDEAINAIDEIYFKLRKSITGNKTKINKSLIVEKALILALNEIESGDTKNLTLYSSIVSGFE
ncbi:MAG: hypothetical protein GY718_09500 [Lentisphaerae bacterium]|nr:hypothetical protein [Lentisphaerota bacterium]